MSVVHDTLGRIMLGAWLYGSAAASGLRPDSDLDFLVVTDRALTAEQKRALVDRLTPLSARRLRPPGWRPVELTVVVQSDVRPWRYPPRLDFQYGEWLRCDFEAGELAPWPATNPDVAMLLTMVRHAARPLVGPPPAELLDPVPRRDLQRAMVEELDGLLADLVPDTRNVLLTLARMWCTLDTGQMRSKDAAA
ncbi:MAG TPA: aminoglycoside adenylyltransferase domain-containing protein, partial [Candidatus Limnocylindria bacterium]|nr:aminoglycoside adenylyltransferase domain-containing protein [Candidatus Limnocylindria bacterium]